jgi:hypothetical protein
MKRDNLSLKALIFLTTSLWCAIGEATTIKYQATNVSGSTWTYEYSVGNDSLGSAIEEFTIFFDLSLYQNLSVSGSPADWDSIVVQPDLLLPDDGYLDALALASGIGVGASQSGYAVQFEYLGTGQPGAQPFDIVDPTTLVTIETGTTEVVPVPAAVWLLLSGVVPLVATSARRRRCDISGS